MSNEESIEQEIQDKGLTAPRITPDHISGMCMKDQYYVFPGTQTTICCITLFNGYTVTGAADCVSAENFDEEIGRKIAFENARNKIWELEGYLLNQRQFDKNYTPHDQFEVVHGTIQIIKNVEEHYPYIRCLIRLKSDHKVTIDYSTSLKESYTFDSNECDFLRTKILEDESNILDELINEAIQS